MILLGWIIDVLAVDFLVFDLIHHYHRTPRRTA